MAENRDKNPLAILFGLVLKQLRAEAKISSKQTAGNLGLEQSTYRVFESGLTPVPPSYATRLVVNFPGLNWSRVAQTLVAVHMIEKIKASPEQMRNTIEDIARLSPVSSQYWRAAAKECLSAEALGSPSDLAARIKESGLVPQFQRFLTDIDPPATAGAFGSAMRWFESKIQRLSPYYFEVVASQLAFFEHFPPRSTPAGLRQWENQNPHRFQKIYGIMRSSELLVSEIPNFDWSYINRPDFQGLYLLTFEEPDIVKSRLASLHRRLTATRKRRHANAEVIAQLLEQKVRLKSLRSSNPQIQRTLESLFQYNYAVGELLPFAGRSEPVLELMNAWLYQIKDTGNVVALVDDKGHDPSQPYQAAVLSWQATYALYEQMELIWRKEQKQDGRSRRTGHSVA